MKVKLVKDSDFAFGGDIKELMPPKEEYLEYRDRDSESWGYRLFSDLFYSGLKKLELNPKEGINKDAAFRHIRAIMTSWQPKHEDKGAACAYLFEHWFESATWEIK